MDHVIELLRERNETVPVPLDLPDDDCIVTAQEEMLIHIPYEYKIFLLEVSDVICGSLEPATIADPHSHTYLPEMASIACDRGLPRYLIPVCQDHNGDYYYIAQDGEVSLWLINGENDEDSDETWPSIWQWAEEVWLES